ncbi:DUF6115 domain-containing protein [Paenibacillus septentrionalis]|uniref:DUF6115 domain-containing protein n=1 Tax=Paenibacillus septentrionalis TaxID=429342 RepID=A0ABW1UXG6_9BACL
MQAWQYVALLGAVVAVAAFLLPRGTEKQKNAGSGAQMEQLELAFEQFMNNMEQEHNDLVKMLTQSLQQLREEDRVKREALARLEQRNAQAEEQLSKLAQQIAVLEAKLQMLTAQPEKLQALASPTSETASQVGQGVGAEVEEAEEWPADSIKKRYAELLDMHHAGKSIETIARKLGKNKGEVQLILQLAMQEEKTRHA